jgi:hypothetical protein
MENTKFKKLIYVLQDTDTYHTNLNQLFKDEFIENNESVAIYELKYVKKIKLKPELT